MIKKILILVLVFGLGIGAGYEIFKSGILNGENFKSPLGKLTETPTPLYEYSFEKLKEKKFTPKKIELVEKMSDGEGFKSWLFKFETDEGWVSGQANLPDQFSILRQAQDKFFNSQFSINNQGKDYPVIIMIRGYVEKEKYQTGIGTKNVAAYFAKNGFVTLAPDFLGYGQSDPESDDDLKSRFIRPATILQLIASIEGNSQIATSQTPRNDGETRELSPKADKRNDIKIGLWGHSNGGQIALSVLELTDRIIPTALWAPVSKPFPYSILYYTDDIDDHGKYLRNLVSDFERDYDAEKFSLINYFSLIKSPIQLHQGTADESVPKKWSDDLAGALKKENIKINYFTYPGADHNLKPASSAGGPGWDTTVKRDLEFFKKEL